MPSVNRNNFTSSQYKGFYFFFLSNKRNPYQSRNSKGFRSTMPGTRDKDQILILLYNEWWEGWGLSTIKYTKGPES